MRLQLFLTALIGFVESSPSLAPIFIFKKTHRGQQAESPAVSPAFGRLLFSQHLSISQFHGLKEADESTITYLNEHKSQQRLLAESEHDAVKAAKLLIFVEGIENMTNPPSPPVNERLARGLSDQLLQNADISRSCVESLSNLEGYFGRISSTRTDTGKCSYGLSNHLDHIQQQTRKVHVPGLEALQELELLVQDGLNKWGGDDIRSVVYVSALQRLAKAEGTSSTAYKEGLALISRVLNAFVSLAESGEQESVVVLLPTSTRNAKRSGDPYGDYTLHARSSLSQHGASEEPLAAPASGLSSDSSTASTSKSLRVSNSTSLPKGILPVCHSSENACVTTTNNCSGHGSCYKKYSAHGSNEEGGKDCYACRCASTVLRDSDTRIKTIHWGGSACQKKDVSMPFFLLASITILLVGVASWGVGLLFSVGQEALPGVIGAGVSGPRAK